jgi:hypothetical protein
MNAKIEKLVTLFLFLAGAALLALSSGCDQPPLGYPPPTAAGPDISGVLTSSIDDSQIDLRADGVFTSDPGAIGTWTASATTITFASSDGEARVAYQLLDPQTMVLDIIGKLVTYRRVPDGPTPVGCWRDITASGDYMFTLTQDGTCAYAGTKSDGNAIGYACTWSIDGDELTVTTATWSSVSTYAIDGGQLTLADGTGAVSRWQRASCP